MINFLPGTKFSVSHCIRIPFLMRCGLGAAAVTCPHEGLTVQRAVSVRRSTTGPVTQSIATPEPSSRTIPTLDRALVAR